MAKAAGRKRKPNIIREANGRANRPTRDEREAKQLQVILAQPHRRGTVNPTAQKHENAFGRFCIRNKLREEIYSAANEYASDVRRVQAAWGAPTDLRLGEGGKGGDGPLVETVRQWEDDLQAIRTSVAARCKDGGVGFAGVRRMIFDGLDPLPQWEPHLVQASFWLAVEMGTMSAKESSF